MSNNLPRFCYSYLRDSHEIIRINCGESGYYKTDTIITSEEEAQAIVNKYNSKLGVTIAQRKAMEVGSMFGWNVPCADPNNYDADGNFNI